MPIINSNLADGVVVTHPELVHLSGCTIGEGSRIGPFVQVMDGVVIGKNCKISSHSYICPGVHISDRVFIGHGVVIDVFQSEDDVPDAQSAGDARERVPRTLIGIGASVGSRATIRAGLRIGEGSLVGAGAVVTSDVPAHTVVVGIPARVTIDARKERSMPSGHRKRVRMHEIEDTGWSA